MGCGSVLLESNARLIKCYIVPRNQLFPQHVQINVLVNYYFFFNGDEGSFFNCFGYTGPNYYRRWFLALISYSLIQKGYVLYSLHKSNHFDDCVSPELLICQLSCIANRLLYKIYC